MQENALYLLYSCFYLVHLQVISLNALGKNMITKGTKHFPTLYLHFTYKYQQCILNSKLPNEFKQPKFKIMFHIKSSNHELYTMTLVGSLTSDLFTATFFLQTAFLPSIYLDYRFLAADPTYIKTVITSDYNQVHSNFLSGIFK